MHNSYSSEKLLKYRDFNILLENIFDFSDYKHHDKKRYIKQQYISYVKKYRGNINEFLEDNKSKILKTNYLVKEKKSTLVKPIKNTSSNLKNWASNIEEWNKIQPSKNDLEKIRSILKKNKVPLYFNYAGVREDLLNIAVESVPKDICEVRILKWGSKSLGIIPNTMPPFSYCLNKILNECEKDFFIFMHYDAKILNEEIVLEIIEEYINRRRAEAWLPNSKVSAFVSALDTSMDCLTVYNCQVLKKLGGFDESYLDSYMESDLIQKCHLLGIPHPHLYPYALGWRNHIEGKFDHQEGILRDEFFEENLKNKYRETFPKDFERFWSKWGVNHWCGLHEVSDSFIRARDGYLKELEYSRTFGPTRDVLSSFDLNKYIEMRKNLIIDFKSKL